MCLSTLCSSAPGGPVCPAPSRTSQTASGDGGRASAAGGRPGGSGTLHSLSPGGLTVTSRCDAPAPAVTCPRQAPGSSSEPRADDFPLETTLGPFKSG